MSEAAPQDNAAQPLPVVRYAPVGEIKIYQVQESELDQLANGSPESTSLNFALVLLPTSLTLVVTLITAEIKSERVYATLVAVACTFALLGLYFAIQWRRSHRTTQRLIDEIKGRMPPPPGIQDALPQPSEGAGKV